MGIFRKRNRNVPELVRTVDAEATQEPQEATAGCGCGGTGHEAVAARREGFKAGQRDGIKQMFHAMRSTVIVVERSHVQAFNENWGDLLDEHRIVVTSPQGARDMNMGLHVKYGTTGPQNKEGVV